MYDDLMEHDPKMRRIFAEKEAQGEAKGEIKGLQIGFIDLVETRFPHLADLARQKVAIITEVSTLHLLIKSIASAPNGTVAQQILNKLTTLIS